MSRRDKFLERAKDAVAVRTGAGYWGRLWESVADALAAVERETAMGCHAIVTANDAPDEADELLWAAQQIRRKYLEQATEAQPR